MVLLERTMIALAKFIIQSRRKKHQPIKYRWPHETVIISGCSFEKIDAQYDNRDRLERLVIYTRNSGVFTRRKRSFLRR